MKKAVPGKLYYGKLKPRLVYMQIALQCYCNCNADLQYRYRYSLYWQCLAIVRTGYVFCGTLVVYTSDTSMATKRRVECDSAPSCAIPKNQEANSEIQQLLARALANNQAEKEYKHFTAISYKKQARRYVIKVSIRRTSNCIYNAKILCIHDTRACTCNLANWFPALNLIWSDDSLLEQPNLCSQPSST